MGRWGMNCNFSESGGYPEDEEGLAGLRRGRGGGGLVAMGASQMTEFEAEGFWMGNKDELELDGRLSRNIFREVTEGRESPANVLTLNFGELGADPVGVCGIDGGFVAGV